MTASRTTTKTLAQPTAELTAAAERVYDAECSLHAAHQSHLDDWIAAAGDNLHAAITAYLAALPNQPA